MLFGGRMGAVVRRLNLFSCLGRGFGPFFFLDCVKLHYLRAITVVMLS